jgi:hypothetical protein
MMNYNTERPHMRFTEYGRITQKLIDHTVTITDRDERNKAARYIVEVMAMLNNPMMRQNEEYRHKLWDHLIIMSDFKLDVDAPYPTPTPQDAAYVRPDAVPYPGNKIKNPTYGKNLERFIEKGLKETDPEKLRGYAEAAAYYMKLVFLNWSKENVNDDNIKSDLKRMSGGVYNLDEDFNLENVKGSTQHAGSSFLVKKPSKNKQRFQQNRNFKGKGPGQGGGGRYFKRK